MWTAESDGEGVTITPYLSRDTTYCYRHCKGITHFPLLLYHPSPRPMPDRITSTSLTFLHVTMPYWTHASNPHHVHCLMDSLVPCYLYPTSPWHHHDVWLRPRLRSYPFQWHHSSTMWPLPLTLTIRTVDCYWLIPIAWWTFPLSLTYCTMLWLTLAYTADWYSPTPDCVAD